MMRRMRRIFDANGNQLEAAEGPCAEAQDEGHQQADQDCRDVDDPAVLRACGNRKWEVDPEAVEEASR
jgi:hypothetical protein